MERYLTLKIKDEIYFVCFKVKFFKVKIISISKKFEEITNVGVLSEIIDFEIIENRTSTIKEYLSHWFFKLSQISRESSSNKSKQ